MIGLVLALAFLAGVLLHDSGVGLLIALPLGLAALLGVLAVKDWSSRAQIACALALIGAGAFRAQGHNGHSPDIVVHLSGADRSIDAVVVGIPTIDTTRTKAKLRLQSAPRSTFTASLPSFPAVGDGDIIRFWAPKSWNVDSPDQVKIPRSTDRRGVFVASIAVVETRPNRIMKTRATINTFVRSAIQEHIGEPAAPLTLGILNGDDSGMTDSTRTAFRLAGMSHITAVSGWNVAMFAGLILIFLRRLSPPRWVTVAFASVLIWTYAYLVGMQPSVLRAAGMATVFVLAHWRGRPGDLLTSLLITLALMIAITPGIRFDVGFQLSVAATLGIVLLLERSDWYPRWLAAVAIPLVAEIAVAPLLLHHFGTFSLLSPFANLVAAPLVVLVMGGGAATVVGTMLHPFLAELAGAFTWVPARLIVAIAEIASSTRWASGTTVKLSWTATWVTYLTIILAYLTWSGTARAPHGASPLTTRDRI